MEVAGRGLQGKIDVAGVFADVRLHFANGAILAFHFFFVDHAAQVGHHVLHGADHFIDRVVIRQARRVDVVGQLAREFPAHFPHTG